MPALLALLGSINVGGIRLAMVDLRKALETAGYRNVETVVASGNVLFDHMDSDRDMLAAEIAAVVSAQFGIASFVAVRNRAELAQAIADNPFRNDGEARYVHTVFLEKPVAKEAVERFAAGFDGPERIAGEGRELFIDYATGVARSRIDPALRKARLIDGRATARNVRSLQRILEKMDR